VTGTFRGNRGKKGIFRMTVTVTGNCGGKELYRVTVTGGSAVERNFTE